jgi:hypothetical protein
MSQKEEGMVPFGKERVKVSQGDTRGRGRGRKRAYQSYLDIEWRVQYQKYKVKSIKYSQNVQKTKSRNPGPLKRGNGGRAQVCYSGTKAIPAMTVDKTRLIFPVL